MRAIWEGRTEWRTLGLELGLSHNTLEAISRDYPQSIKDCFCEMMYEWLKSGGTPSWETLISALKSPLVGLQGLANEFEKVSVHVVSVFLSITVSSSCIPPRSYLMMTLDLPLKNQV